MNNRSRMHLFRYGRSLPLLLGVLLSPSLVAGETEKTDDTRSGLAGQVLDLKYKTYRNWDLVLPQQSFARVSGDFHFPAFSSSPFTVRMEGNALRIDKDADGKEDARVEAPGGLVTLRARSEAGTLRRYSVRLKKTRAGWAYAVSGAALGFLDGQKIRIIDQNNNGRYDDYGEDAMVIGQGRYASFLSKVVNVRGKLYAIEVSKDGRTLSYEPYAGASGTLDLAGRFATKGKLCSVVIRGADHRVSFNMTGAPIKVPAGTYHLVGGRIGLGRNEVNFSEGRFKPVTVAVGETKSVALGEPLTIDFSYAPGPGRVVLDPKWVRYLGRGGELYKDWTPFGGSPQFEVKDKDTGRPIARAVFGATCSGFAPAVVRVPPGVANPGVWAKAKTWAFEVMEGVGAAAGDANQPPSLWGRPAPDFELPRLDGGRFKLGDRLGKDVIVLDFWATWCGPCIAAIPNVIEVVKSFEGQGVTLVGINQEEPAQKVKSFIKARNWDLDVVLDESLSVRNQYGVEAIPTTFVIGRDGKVVMIHRGFSPRLKEDLTADIKRALE